MKRVNRIISDVMEEVGKITFGRSRKKCLRDGICISCGLPARPRCHSPADIAEYRLSVMCGECFSKTIEAEFEERSVRTQ